MGVLVNELNNDLRRYNGRRYLDIHFLRSVRGVRMSQHNQLNWSDFLLCIASELAYTNLGMIEEDPIKTQMICEKIESLGGKL